jgi:hypothetical protein
MECMSIYSLTVTVGLAYPTTIKDLGFSFSLPLDSQENIPDVSSFNCSPEATLLAISAQADMTSG